jgi:hypothetical protein
MSHPVPGQPLGRLSCGVLFQVCPSLVLHRGPGHPVQGTARRQVQTTTDYSRPGTLRHARRFGQPGSQGQSHALGTRYGKPAPVVQVNGVPERLGRLIYGTSRWVPQVLERPFARIHWFSLGHQHLDLDAVQITMINCATSYSY